MYKVGRDDPPLLAGLAAGSFALRKEKLPLPSQPNHTTYTSARDILTMRVPPLNGLLNYSVLSSLYLHLPFSTELKGRDDILLLQGGK
jgi:hypothetical protein